MFVCVAVIIVIIPLVLLGILNYKFSSLKKETRDYLLESLKNLEKDRKLILAGRTLNTEPFGIVILEVDTEEDEIMLMENDPAVKEGIMEAKLFPYRVPLL